MSIYKSKININSENFEKNKNEMIALIEKVHKIQGRAEKYLNRGDEDLLSANS